MAEQQYSNNGPALTASLIVAALLDKLIAKGVLTADDVNNHVGAVGHVWRVARGSYGVPDKEYRRLIG